MKKFLVFVAFMCGVVGNICVPSLALAFGADSVIYDEATVDDQELDNRLGQDDELGEDGIINQEKDRVESLPEVFIKAVNPGYAVDGVNNVGEMIEIGKNSNAPISLAGLAVSYTNSSGNSIRIMEFPEGSLMVGETILLRLASSPESELANLKYSKTLAFKAGPLELRRGDEVIDMVCWTGKDDCASEFKSVNPTTLVRNLETGIFEHKTEYLPFYAEGSYQLEEPSDEKSKEELGHCRGLIFSEVLGYYDIDKTEQFIEFYNSNSEQILLDGCQIKYKNGLYALSGVLKPEEYLVRTLNDFNITKNPTNSNVLEIVDTDGEIIDKLVYPNGQRRGASYALIGYDKDGSEIWRVTYAVTPGESNIYQEFKSCEVGKVINEETGNCVKATEVVEKVCGEGQYLNILTGRCRKIETTKEITECKEGYYRSEETGRCRKIVENTGADYSLAPETYEESSSFIALSAVGIIVLIGVIYIIYEFRKEILKLFRKVFRRFH